MHRLARRLHGLEAAQAAQRKAATVRPEETDLDDMTDAEMREFTRDCILKEAVDIKGDHIVEAYDPPIIEGLAEVLDERWQAAGRPLLNPIPQSEWSEVVEWIDGDWLVWRGHTPKNDVWWNYSEERGKNPVPYSRDGRQNETCASLCAINRTVDVLLAQGVPVESLADLRSYFV
jgi:hypothetical protein